VGRRLTLRPPICERLSRARFWTTAAVTSWTDASCKNGPYLKGARSVETRALISNFYPYHAYIHRHLTTSPWLRGHGPGANVTIGHEQPHKAKTAHSAQHDPWVPEACKNLVLQPPTKREGHTYIEGSSQRQYPLEKI